MTLFATVLAAVLGLLLRTTQVTSSNTRRVVAANLATKQIEAARSQQALAIPDGLVTRTETVGSTTYTIAQTSNYLPSDSATSVCSGSGNNLAYKLVSVDVTWPHMGTIKPVHSDTLRTLGLGADGLDPTQGAIAVALVTGNGSPVSGVQVTLSPGSITRTTGADGCAVFVGLTAGQNYTASANQTGYVSNTNAQQLQNANLGVRASEVTRGTLLYDTAASMNLTWDIPAGYPVPNLPLLLRNSYLSDRSYPSCSSLGGTVAGCVDGVPGTAQNLFPATYDVWAGSCTDARTPVTVTLAAGGSQNVAVPLAPVRISFVDGMGQPLSAAAVQVTHAAEVAPPSGSFCGSGETWALSAGSGLQTKGALPTGQWTFSASGFTPATVTLGTVVTDVTLTVAP